MPSGSTHNAPSHHTLSLTHTPAPERKRETTGGRFVLSRPQSEQGPGEAVVVEVAAEGGHAGDEDVEAEVELALVDEEGAREVALRHAREP
eukprot:3446460-Rhodomonas_salina.3